MPTLEEMKSVVNKLLEGKRAIIKDCRKHGCIAPSYDLRDFTDKRLIYGMRKTPVKIDHTADLENFNLGSCLTHDTAIPQYKFFHFDDLYDELCGIYDECKIKSINIRKVPLDDVIGSVFNVLSNGDKYFRTISGSETGYRICIFLYGGPYTDDLDDLAQQFRERDLEEARSISSYFCGKLTHSCDRILDTI